MTAENMQWETLDQHQASLMIGRVVAGSLCVFGKAAQQAGIGLLNGTRFTVTAGEHTYDSVAWPDNAMPQTTCYVMSNDKLSSDGPLTFARITDQPRESQYVVEGVALNVGSRSSISSRLYGIGRQPYGAMGGDTSVAAAGLGFFSRAMAVARQRERALRYAPPNETPAIIGVRGDKVGSLVSSLITLDANLVFGLSMNEQGRITDRTYDQAQAMLKKVISDSLSGKPSSATVLPGGNGQPVGALFASDEYGLTIIRRINTYPQTIALTLATRPDKDPGSIVEQYFIQPRGAFMNINTLREDDYNSQALLSMLPVLDGAIHEEVTRRINLDPDGLDALDLKMVKILGSRIFQPVN